MLARQSNLRSLEDGFLSDFYKKDKTTNTMKDVEFKILFLDKQMKFLCYLKQVLQLFRISHASIAVKGSLSSHTMINNGVRVGLS